MTYVLLQAQHKQHLSHVLNKQILWYSEYSYFKSQSSLETVFNICSITHHCSFKCKLHAQSKNLEDWGLEALGLHIGSLVPYKALVCWPSGRNPKQQHHCTLSVSAGSCFLLQVLINNSEILIFNVHSREIFS